MKPRLAVAKFASCDGCQLQLLNAEDELLILTNVVDLAYFPEARRRQLPGPYDIALVEGSITTPADAERLQRLRAETRVLVTIGACATAGGVQALRNWADVEEYKRAVYPHPDWISSLATSTPIAAHVTVDYELWGCPVDKDQLLAVLRALLSGTVPGLPTHSVCMTCKQRGLTCVVVARDAPCLGPVTRTGCGAICPAMGRGCYGCFGPSDQPNLPAFTALLAAQGLTPDEARRRLRGINGWAPAFRRAGDALATAEEAEQAEQEKPT
ncbi:MAG TPA: oxidoreductase [Candidatus Dormibacteraeota bacterium]|nr:oxidoreductase [Candidatus Dormibacteraeota bacterium]